MPMPDARLLTAAQTTMLARAALAGAATGSRSLTGLAAAALSAPAGAAAQPDATLRRGWVRGLAVSAALAELVTDQRPGTPSRLAPAGLAGRVVLGAATGAILARRAGSPAGRTAGDGAAVAAAAAVAAGTAVAAAWAGARWRAAAARRFGGDRPGALIEDAAALSVAALSVAGPGRA
ncbi:MAG TPA: hypothetical protein VGH88_00380 [Streptosporangiaceae bacterium]